MDESTISTTPGPAASVTAVVQETEKDDGTGKTPMLWRPRTHRASATTRILGQLMFDRAKKSKDPVTKKTLHSGGNGSWAMVVMFFEKNPTIEVLRSLIMERVWGKMARFRSQLVVGRINSYYKELPIEAIDLAYHISQTFLPGEEAPWSRDKLFEYIGGLNSYEYDLTKPLWRFILVPEMDNGQSTVIFCINHAIGDGLSLIDVLFSMFDPPEEKKSGDGKTARYAGKRATAPAFPLYRRVGLYLYGIGLGFATAFLRPDPPNSLKLKDSTKPSPVKLLAATEPIPMEKMKEIKNKFEGATLNDILMTIMTLTLKAYYREEGTLTKNLAVSGQFPISVRSKGEGGLSKDGEPHNKFFGGFFNFNFKCEDRLELVWRVKRQMDKIKLSPAPVIGEKVVKALIKVMPRRMLLDTVINASNIGTGSLSNVPGPQGPMYLAGLKMDEMTFFLFSPLGMYFGIMSYNGTVSAAINLDASLGVDPKLVAKHWKTEFDALYEQAMAHDGPIPPPNYGCCG